MSKLLNKELINEAESIIRESGYASSAQLQRKLQLDYETVQEIKKVFIDSGLINYNNKLIPETEPASNLRRKGAKLMVIDVGFYAFDYVLLYLWLKFLYWFFENPTIITILSIAALFGLLSQTWNFFNNLSLHWKLFRGKFDINE